MRLPALLLAVAAIALWPQSNGRAQNRLQGLRGPGQIEASSAGASTSAGALDRRAVRWLACAATGLGVALAWGGAAGLVAGLVVAAGGLRLIARTDTAEERRRRRRRAEDLPSALDLVCVCLRAGLPVDRALSQVAAVLDGPLRDDLAVVCALYDLGAEARLAWSDLATDPVLAPVARALARTGSSGSAVATTLARLAEQCRAQLQEEAEVAARRVGVFVLAPLGLCFLPAFVCLGVVPTILGVAGTVLG